MRLGVNIDHVATLRNARGGILPSPLRAAEQAIAAGADGITIHLREDRRHIRDSDAIEIMAKITKPLNFEMAVTKEMVDFALKLKPHAACLVPERREERTTEGGLDVVRNFKLIKPTCLTFKKSGIRTSLFIAPDPNQINAAYDAGAPVIELHTGAWCDYLAEGKIKEADAEFRRLREGIKLAATLGLEVHAGHGLNYETAAKLAQFSEIKELNIGHFIVGEAVFIGLTSAIQNMKAAMSRGAV